MSLLFKIFTIFPEIFPGCLDSSVTGIALKKNLWNYQAINIRDYATDKHKIVDDEIYGGGCGMLLKPDIIANAIDANLDFINNSNSKKKLIYMSPRGKLFNQKMAQDFANLEELSIICGRYEGIDQRVIEEYDIEEISMGNFILSGGEVAALPLMDAIIRNIDGVLGNKQSLKDESFSINYKNNKNFLEYDQYTRPAIWRGREVPKVLRSGNHELIKKWKEENYNKK
jgi:tRNA (guanine37-N1)-methyltransferase